MSKNNIEDSQQQSQGVTIGTQGNQDMPIPQGVGGPNRSKEETEDKHIPNQERSSSSNQERSENS